MSRSVVFLLGAGASVADVAGRPMKQGPPLDRGFFLAARTTLGASVLPIQRYIRTTYGYDITDAATDLLEAVMSQIYTDVFNPNLQPQATMTFTGLMRLFTRRLAETTNAMDPTNQRWLYPMLTSYLLHDTSPSDMTLITFNQDLQIEKTRDILGGAMGQTLGPRQD